LEKKKLRKITNDAKKLMFVRKYKYMKGEKKEFKSDRNIMTGMSSPKRDQREGKIHHLSQMSKKQKKKLLERFFFISFLSSLFFVTGFCFLYSEDFFFVLFCI